MKVLRFCGLFALMASAATAPAMAGLTITLQNTGGVAMGSAAYAGFRAAADYWQSVITTNVNVNLRVGFNTTGFNNANVIGSTASTAFIGVNVEDVYQQLAATGNSQLDMIAVAHLSPLTPVAAYYDATQTIGAVSAITQQAQANGNGVVQNTRAANPNGGAANGLNGIETVSNREFDADGSRNNQDLRVNASVLKALGYVLPNSAYSPANRDANGNGVDGTVRFNSAFAFDFDPRDGISPGRIDFLGTAIHEIGHALGFVSGVDIYDTNTNIPANLDTLQGLMSTLDLFRYSDDVNNLAPGSGQALDWSVGNSATAGDPLRGRPFFSFDGVNKGLSGYGGDSGYFSTGSTNGDGRQASHWLDTPYRALPGNSAATQCLTPVVPSHGILDPTFAGCELGVVTALDLAAYDALGWNINVNLLTNTGYRYSSRDAFIASLPEPGTWAMLLVGFGFVGMTMRRRAPKLVAA